MRQTNYQRLPPGAALKCCVLLAIFPILHINAELILRLKRRLAVRTVRHARMPIAQQLVHNGHPIHGRVILTPTTYCPVRTNCSSSASNATKAARRSRFSERRTEAYPAAAAMAVGVSTAIESAQAHRRNWYLFT